MRNVGMSGLGVMIMLGVVVAVRGAQHSAEPLSQVKTSVQAKHAVLVDVREKSEWDRGHLEGALLIPLSLLTEWEQNGIPQAQRAKLETLIPKGTIVYCHCAAGGRAVPAGEIFRKLGFDSRALRVGYRDLLAAGFPRSAK